MAATRVEPVFRREGDAFVPTIHSRGPWDPGAQHGGAPAALLAEAVREPGMHVARLTYDFVGPVPVGVPLRVETRLVRPGGRLQLVEADLVAADGAPVVRLRAMRLRRGEVAGPARRPDAEAIPGRRAGPAEPSDFPLEPPDAEGFHRTAMEIRFAAGTSYGRGPRPRGSASRARWSRARRRHRSRSSSRRPTSATASAASSTSTATCSSTPTSTIHLRASRWGSG